MIINELRKEKRHLTKVCFEPPCEVLLDNDIVSQNGLFKGLEVTEEQLKELVFESDYQRAKSRALWYLDRMDYTEKALYEKLIKAGFDKNACARVLQKLCELEIVSDRRYAQRYAERCKENNISKREAIHKMLQKGISYDLAKEALENIDMDEGEQLADLIAKKYSYKLTCENGAQKVFSALVRKGFSYSSVKAALKKYNEDIEFCEE